jgi:hypothetical protein
VREENGEIVVDVSWPGFSIGGPDAKDLTYTLAVVPDGSERFHDIYTGREAKHVAQGLKPGQNVAFAVRASNFYGSSDYSAPSEPVFVPKVCVWNVHRRDMASPVLMTLFSLE